MRVVEEHIGSIVVPISNAEVTHGFDNVRKGDVYLIGNIRLRLCSWHGINKRYAIAHRDHLRRG